MKKLIFIMLIGIGCQAAQAQIPQPDPDTTAKHFLTVASIKNVQEVSAAQLAVQHSKNTDFKAFVQMMLKDHGTSEQKLLQLAKYKNIMIPAEASSNIQPDPMLKNAGANFDQLYIHAMLAGHQNTVEVFQNYATTGKDADVRAFAAQMLPTLKMHLQHIQMIEKQLK